MSRRFRRKDTGHGKWSVLDTVLGYRICSHNRHAHGGVHVHYPLHGPVVGILPSLSLGRAEALVRRCARRHAAFDMTTLRREVRLWSSR